MTGSEIDHVRKWVETSGRALELRVSRAFRAGAGEVQDSFRYDEEGKDRETDVLVSYRSRHYNSATELRVVVECKHSSSGEQWVGFDAGRVTSGELSECWFAAPTRKARESLQHAWAWEPLFSGWPLVSSVAPTRNSNNRDSAYAAIQQVRSGALAQRLRMPNGQEDETWSITVVPLIVTSIPLYRCSLADDNAVVVELVERLAVREGNHLVYLVNETALSQCIRGLEQLCGRI